MRLVILVTSGLTFAIMIHTMNTKELLAKVEKARELYVAFATHSREIKYEELESVRNELLAEPQLKSVIPDWFIKNRHGSQFWDFIKGKFSTYQERRVFLNDEFGEITEFIEKDGIHPVSISVEEWLGDIDTSDLDKTWRKIHARKDIDIEGAITASRTMVESTIKQILDSEGVSYTNSDDLNDLYKKVAKLMNLSPEGHDEQLFKQILGGISSIVGGFAAVRNAYGDAHGKGVQKYLPEPRHAELVINLAGTLCTFLIKTNDAQRVKN